MEVQADADPAFDTEVRGPEEPLRVEIDQRLLVAQRDLAAQGHATVAVVVVEVVREGPASDLEPDVLALVAGDLGQGAADLIQPGTAPAPDRRVHAASLPEGEAPARQRTIITGTVACACQ